MRSLRFPLAFFGVLFAQGMLDAQEATYSVTVATARRSAFDEEIKTFAQVEPDPKTTTTIVAPVNGTIQSVLSLVGDRVAAGDVVAVIATDPVLLAQTKAAGDTLRYAQEALSHQTRLFSQQLTTRDQVASAQRDVAIAEANLAAASRLGSDQSQLEVKSTVTGVVSSVPSVPGQQVVQGTAIATMADPGALLIRPGVEPADSRRIKPGDRTTVVAVMDPSDVSGEAVTLTVSTVGNTMDPRTRLVPITIVISGDAASKFLSGQTVQVVFHSDSANTVTTSRSALEYDGTTPIVFVVEDGKAVRRVVTLAGTTDDKIFVADGLKDGEPVIVGGLSGLTDGAIVKVTAP